MIDPEVRRELEQGASLILGTTSPDLQPLAARAWGLRLGHDIPLVVRLMIEGGDDRILANLAPGNHFAVTSANIDSLVSFQLKCRSLGLEPLDEQDRIEGAAQRAAFLQHVARVDAMPIDVLERWARPATVTCVAEVLHLFDQTPGPRAGRSLEV